MDGSFSFSAADHAHSTLLMFVFLSSREEFPQARSPLEHWYQLTRAGRWRTPADVKQDFGGEVDFVGNHRAVFNIQWNEFRLIGEINYRRQAVFIRFLGTHEEYEKVDADTVRRF
jgi:mRNA interferase HigB